MTKVAVIDYGVGNLFNLARALVAVGGESVLVDRPDQLRAADRVILPGVGAFASGIEHLAANDMTDAVRDYARIGRPVLGVCLGMQLLLSESEEGGIHAGLNLIPGRVVKFSSQGSGGDACKVPQIAWNSIKVDPGSNRSWSGTVLDSIPDRAPMYFVHSYYAVTENPEHALAISDYAGRRYCAVVQAGHIMGCQFHPERSAQHGLQLLRNFLAM